MRINKRKAYIIITLFFCLFTFLLIGFESKGFVAQAEETETKKLEKISYLSSGEAASNVCIGTCHYRAIANLSVEWFEKSILYNLFLGD